MTKSRLLCAIVLLFAVANSAWGKTQLFDPSDRTGTWELSIQTRYTGSRDYDGEHGSSLSFDDDLGYGFNVGYNINERFNLGASASWRTVGYSAHVVSADDPEKTLDYTDWMDTANLAFNAVFNVLPKRFTPFLQGAIGWAMVDTNVPSDVEGACWWDPWWGETCVTYVDTYSEDAVSYGLGAGLSCQVTDLWSVRAGYEKLWVDAGASDDFDIARLDVGFRLR